MSIDKQWGPWIAHNGDKMPKGVEGCEVEVRRLDMSSFYLPDGKYDSYIFDDGCDATWVHNDHCRHIIAYRVKPKETTYTGKCWAYHYDNMEPTFTHFNVSDICTYGTYTATHVNGKPTRIVWEAGE